MDWKNRRPVIFIPVFTLLFLLTGCIKYSFTGTNIDPSIKTMTIQNFENNSGEGPSFLTTMVSEEFRTYFQRNSNLKLATQGGDIQLEGQILSYNFSPAAIQNSETQGDIAGANRLTIRLQVRFHNTKDPKQDFDQAFSSFRDFPQSQNISQIDERSLREIVERMVQDVFNRSLANW
jgi:hypothetical protein